MRFFFFSLLLTAGLTTSLMAQSRPKTVNLEKGQVFDIIFLTNNSPVSKDLMQDYFKRTSPLAKPNGYVGGGGFGITGTPTRGNYHPHVMAIGTWPSVEQRAKGVIALETGMKDFHEMRRKIWPTFNLTYYRMKQDVSLTFDPEKYYVATMLWAGKKGKFRKYTNQWEALQLKQGGRQMITLTEGASPFGYHFNPTYFTVVEWDSEADFRKIYAEEQALGTEGLLHVNQFSIK